MPDAGDDTMPSCFSRFLAKSRGCEASEDEQPETFTVTPIKRAKSPAESTPTMTSKKTSASLVGEAL